MNKAFLLLGLALILGGGRLEAQSGQLRKGDRSYERMMYPSAARHYEKGLAKAADLRAMERIADAYEQLGDYANAERWYAQVANTKGVSPNSLYRYGMVLRANGKHDEARKWFEAYRLTEVNPTRAARMIEACDYAVKARLDSGRYQVSPEPCNSKGSEFGPTLYQQGYLFVAEARSGGRRILNQRNNNAFYDLYYAERDPKRKSGVRVQRLKGQVNRKYHDGPASVTKDQSTLYFTRSAYVADRKGKSPMQHSKLRVMRASLSRGKWKSVTPLAFNSDNYNCGHPAISADGNVLVFASDIPGGFGGADLYVCYKEGEAWGVPQNLGSAINTDGEEQFPYLHSSGALFFASDGQPGLGGFDIFFAEKQGERWGQATNAGYGLNSQRDDFSITWLPNKSAGYFASDRSGSDDIYQFKRQTRMGGTIVDGQTGKPVKGATVTILDASNREIKYVTEEDGKFSHAADWGKEYLVTVTKPDYLQLRERMNTGDVSPLRDLERTLTLEHDLILSVSGQVTDASTGQPLPGATVRVITTKDRPYTTDAQGSYYAALEPDKEYSVVISKQGYVPQVFTFNTDGKTRSEDFRVAAALVPGKAVLVEGQTVVNETKEPIGGVHVGALSGADPKESATVQSRRDGRFWQVVDPRSETWLIASKEGFFASRAELPGLDSNSTDTSLGLVIGMVPYEVGALVKIIYYEYNRSEIRRVASKDLMEIVYFLKDNPSASVELDSYTDARGGAKYNQRLSQMRADAAVAFIHSKGIAASRLASRGDGEANPANRCVDGVECSEEEHAANRRTEIRITKVK